MNNEFTVTSSFDVLSCKICTFSKLKLVRHLTHANEPSLFSADAIKIPIFIYAVQVKKADIKLQDYIMKKAS